MATVTERRTGIRSDEDIELPIPQLARALNKPEPAARRILEEASRELRRRLREAGCRFKVSDV